MDSPNFLPVTPSASTFPILSIYLICFFFYLTISFFLSFFLSFFFFFFFLKVKVTMADAKDTLMIINVPRGWEQDELAKALTEVCKV
jgi:hypothetical protein